MNDEQIVSQLQVFVDYFNETTGATPVCFVEAINKINQYRREKMYQPPIELMINQVSEKITEQGENKIIASINQSCGIDINKEELIKALNYDRNQYEKGYADGELAENSRLFKTCDTLEQVKAIVADYYETVAEARSTYVRTEASKIWLADAILDLFKENEADNEKDT